MNYVIEGKPLSVNHTRKPAKIKGALRMVTTKEAKAWKLAACWSLKSQRGTTPTIKGPCVISITAFLPINLGDVDNYAKATLDALQEAGIIDNDRQVQRMCISKEVDRSRPRTEITVIERA